MMYLHPVLQILATLLGLYVFILGINRFRFLHLGQKVGFKRKRHVKLGLYSLVLGIVGTFLGLIMVRIAWHGFFVTGLHGQLGFVALVLMFVGLLSGWFLYKMPQKTKTLPLIHGLANSLVLLLALIQVYLGFYVVEVFLQGA